MNETVTITVEELLERIEHAKQRMSRKNAHRLLLLQCQQALIQLAQQVGEQSAPKGGDDAPIRD